MTTRDELAALIYPYFGTPDGDIDALNAADAILAAYRVEKREPPKHWPANAPGLVVCALCGEHWPCHTRVSDRDELHAEIHNAARMQDRGLLEGVDLDRIAHFATERILARWRLVPVESELRTMPREFSCPECGKLAYVDGIEGGTGRDLTISILHFDRMTACLLRGDDAQEFVTTWPKAST